MKLPLATVAGCPADAAFDPVAQPFDVPLQQAEFVLQCLNLRQFMRHLCAIKL